MLTILINCSYNSCKEQFWRCVSIKQTIVFDFDGVLNRYENGWQGANIIDEEPVDGMVEFLSELSDEYRIVILSSRCTYPGGKSAVETWLDNYKMKYDLVTDVKPQALAYVDDRAIRFKGNIDLMRKQIKNIQPWNMHEGEIIEYIPSPGDNVEFEIFKGEGVYKGKVMYEFEMTNHINASFNNRIFYRIISECRSYDIPFEHIKKKVG